MINQEIAVVYKWTAKPGQAEALKSIEEERRILEESKEAEIKQQEDYRNHDY